jgi:hypothetical protein
VSTTLCRAIPVVLAALVALAPRVLPAQDKVDRRAAAASDIAVRVGGTYGALRVLGWEKDSIAITGVVPRGTRVDGGFGAGVARGAKFWIEPPAGAPAGDARLELRVPVGARVWVKTGSADVEVRDVRGGLDLNVIGGSVRVTGDPRELAIESMDGNVTIDGAPAWLRVKTATGSIELRGGAGDAALATVSGAVRVTGGAFDRARLEAVTGDLLYAGMPARGGELVFDTHSGRIELALPPRTAVQLEATTITGTIDNALNATAPRAGREGRGAELVLDGGAGAPRIVARSFKGTIALRAGAAQKRMPSETGK